MANAKFTDLPTVSSAQLSDIICAVQPGMVSGTSVQETLQQVVNLGISQTILSYAGNPNGNLAGNTYQLCWDTTDKIMYVCTTSGSAASAVWTSAGSVHIPVLLSEGGTSADLTASNGGIFYSTASTGAILSGTATANQIVMSGSSTAPSWSTATYPPTTTVNQLLYSSSSNVIAGLATIAAGVLTTVSSVPTWASTVSLALGGTNASLTASNGGIFYSTASAGAILAGTATSTQMLQSGSSAAPAWSTSTWPATTTANQLLYSSSNNTVAGLTSANSATLITSGAGVPSISQTLPTTVQGNITQLGAQSQALNMNTNLINNVVDPVSAQDAATKNYVDAHSTGLTVLPGSTAATTANLNATYNNGASGVGATLTNAGSQAAFAVDGYSASLNDIILVKNQTTQADNGIYKVTTLGSGASNWVLTRVTYYDTSGQIIPGTFTTISNGSTNANLGFIETNTITTVGTDPIAFSPFGVAMGVTSIATNNGITGGTITTTGTIGLASIANNDILANISGGSAAPSANTLTAIIDSAIGNTQGDILYRNSSAWVVLAPGTNGQVLKTQGAAANPVWASVSAGSVTSVGTAGLATGGPITTTGTVTVTAASKTDQETATSTTTAVTPAVQQYHPSATQAWVAYDQLTPTINGSYNVSSVTNNSTGNFTVNFTVPFASSNYAFGSTAVDDSGIPVVINQYDPFGPQTGSCQFRTFRTDTGGVVSLNSYINFNGAQ